MRISDWSSDVCSSDLSRLLDEIYADAVALMHRHRRQLERIADLVVANGCIGGDELRAAIGSEEDERTSVVEGKSVSGRVHHGGRRIIKKNTTDIYTGMNLW